MGRRPCLGCWLAVAIFLALCIFFEIPVGDASAADPPSTSRARRQQRVPLATGTNSSPSHLPPAVLTAPAAAGDASDAWRPLRLSVCAPGSPPHFAPCLSDLHPNLELGEELLYPDFRLRLPRFVSQEQHGALWTALFRPAQQADARWAYFRGQHGQNLIFKDIVYDRNPLPGQWLPTSCMGPDVATTAFKPQPLDALGPSPEPLAAFLSSPDDWSWPHFLDRVASMLVQAEYHMPNVTAYIVNKPLVPAVADAWDALPFTALRRVRGTGRMAARRLLFPCRTPLVHPYLALRLSELLLHAAGVGRRADLPPVADKKVVLMLHRDESSRNGGRQLVNRQEVEAAVRELLRRRGRGETLRTFRLADYSGGLLEVVRFMSMQVRAAIGVHGAAMHNMRFTGPGTLWVEILPVEPAAGPGGLATMYWELAACLGQHYWAVPAKVVSEESDVAVEPGLLVQLLGNALDSPADPRGATVKPAYPWRQARRKPQSPSAALLMSGP